MADPTDTPCAKCGHPRSNHRPQGLRCEDGAVLYCYQSARLDHSITCGCLGFTEPTTDTPEQGPERDDAPGGSGDPMDERVFFDRNRDTISASRGNDCVWIEARDEQDAILLEMRHVVVADLAAHLHRLAGAQGGGESGPEHARVKDAPVERWRLESFAQMEDSTERFDTEIVRSLAREVLAVREQPQEQPSEGVPEPTQGPERDLVERPRVMDALAVEVSKLPDAVYAQVLEPIRKALHRVPSAAAPQAGLSAEKAVAFVREERADQEPERCPYCGETFACSTLASRNEPPRDAGAEAVHEKVRRLDDDHLARCRVQRIWEVYGVLLQTDALAAYAYEDVVEQARIAVDALAEHLTGGSHG